MEIYTIEVGFSVLAVVDGKTKGSRLKYSAPNLEIYVYGAVSKHKRDKVHYHAMSLCLARHIPLKKLVCYGWV